MLITVVGVVFITLAVVLFSVGNFKGARVLVPLDSRCSYGYGTYKRKL